MNKSGIYALRSVFDERTYVGSTKHLEKRKTQHFARLKNKVHKNRYLQNFYNKYGEGGLKFEVLEYCAEEELIGIEQQYLDKIPKKLRFNIVEDVSKPPSTKGMIYTKEWRENISKSLKGYKHDEGHRQKRREYMLGDKNPMNSAESRKAVSDGRRIFTIGECKRIWELNQSEKYCPSEIAQIMAFSDSVVQSALGYASKYLFPSEEIYKNKNSKRKFSNEKSIELLIEYNNTPLNIKELSEKYDSSGPIIDRALRRARELRPDLTINPNIAKKKSRRLYDIEGNYIWKKKQKQYLTKEEISEIMSRAMRRFSDDECMTIGKEYEKGNISQEKLANKYRVDRSCIKSAIKFYKRKGEEKIKYVTSNSN